LQPYHDVPAEESVRAHERAAWREVYLQTLYVLPRPAFHLGRIKQISSVPRASRAAVARSQRANVVWIEKFGYEAAQDWTETIDLSFLDGDHSQEAIWQNWESWYRFVAPGGCVVFHDARQFPNG